MATERRAVERKKKIRKAKGKLEPKAMARAMPKLRKADAAREGKGKGKGSAPTKKEADYEHAGVGIAIHKKLMKHVEEVREVNGRIMVLKLKAAGGDLALISIC